MALVLTTGACAGSAGGVAASCADEIAIDGTQYIAGRGDGAAQVPRAGSELRGSTVACADGNPPITPVVAHAIPGVQATDAVLGAGGELMLAQRLWDQPWASLPRALHPYVRR